MTVEKEVGAVAVVLSAGFASVSWALSYDPVLSSIPIASLVAYEAGSYFAKRDDLPVPFLKPPDHRFTRSTLQLALDADPLDDHFLSIDPVDPSFSELEIFGILVVEIPSGIFTDPLFDIREAFAVSRLTADQPSTPPF